MMALNRKGCGFGDEKPSSRSFLSIDLNEVPSASSFPTAPSPRDALAVVLSFHDRFTPVSGSPAHLPAGSASSACAACRMPEQSGCTIVCDGCERGFHLRCTCLSDGEVSSLEEWICEECTRVGVRSHRWQLGVWNCSDSLHQKRTDVRLFDINALPSSDGEAESGEVPRQDLKNNLKASDAKVEANDGMELLALNNILPIRFEDFYILSLGKVDMRPSYHDVGHIWPVGYRSCWHDKVTGSIFSSEVLDGGDAGPVFRVCRSSCSTTPIPSGTSVVFGGSSGKNEGKRVKEVDCGTSTSMTCDVDDVIQMIMFDSCPPTEVDVLSCLGGHINSHYRTLSHQDPESGACGEAIIDSSCDNTQTVEDVGEFSFEGYSSSAVWKMVSQKLIDNWCETFKNQTNRSACKHLNNELSTSQWNAGEDMQPSGFSKLAKLFGSPRSGITLTGLFLANERLEFFSESLHSWIDEDRFGLDEPFVQEIIEQLPGVRSCTKYRFLNERTEYSKLVTIKNHLLSFEMKGDIHGGEGPFSDLFAPCISMIPASGASLVGLRPPLPGRPLSTHFPCELVGDALQVWELLWQFHEVLGLKESFSFKLLEQELESPVLDILNPSQRFEVCGDYSSRADKTGEEAYRSGSKSNPISSGENMRVLVDATSGKLKEPTVTDIISQNGTALTKVHGAFLKVLVGEFQSRVATLVKPSPDIGESKLRRGRKKDVDMSRTKLRMFPMNELTWPEVARRYILALLAMDGNTDSVETIARESMKIFRCLCGDGGVLCGSRTGVAGMEVDALLLAEAEKQIFSSLGERDTFIVEDSDCTENGSSNGGLVNESSIPEWALPLEPVRKLPTNVGTRIRKCVYEALGKGPPEWAKNILEHSISKEVYKGNASGPTKKAVLSVLAQVQEDVRHQAATEKKRKTVVVISDLVMRQCRRVLRRAASSSDAKFFYNLLGRKFTNYGESDDGGILGFPGMVSRPLDFRAIDLRLSFGAYNGSPEAFFEDVREVWCNIRTSFMEQQNFLELVDALSQKFELLYQEEVLTLFQKLVRYSKSTFLSPEEKADIYDTIASVNVIPKAPWDEGVCKICGVDKDDDSVLLCDTCDAEYHTYCLSPPLVRIPEGNWYCPSCAKNVCRHPHDSLAYAEIIDQCNANKHIRDGTCHYLGPLTSLSTSMEVKEYWELSLEERTFLLKFLSDESLNSALIRQHLEYCAEKSTEAQQKLRSISLEWKNLKLREQILVSKAAKLESNALRDVFEVKACEGLVNHCNCVEKQANISMLHPESGKEQIDSNGMSLRKTGIPSQIVTSADAEMQIVGGLATVDNCHHNCSSDDTEPLTKNQPCGNLTLSSSPNDSNISDEGVVPWNDVTWRQAYSEELNSIRSELSVLQDSIMSTETQLLTLSARREFLGRDSAGRLYWMLPKSGKMHWLVVDGSALQQAEEQKCMKKDLTITDHSNWIVLESDEEIDDLIQWLRDGEPFERELKESIVHWKKFKLEGHLQSSCFVDDETCDTFSKRGNESSSNNLATTAAAVLERKYGHFSKFCVHEITGIQGINPIIYDKDQMYRCQCLEPIWPCRSHCLSCHKSFASGTDLKQHKTDKCISVKGYQYKNGNGDKITQRNTIISKCRGVDDVVEPGRNDSSELSTRIVRFENEVCPFNFEQICSRFVTENCNKELVHEIGLIGSDGVPSFVPFVSPYIDDSSLMLIPSEEGTNANNFSDPQEAGQTSISDGHDGNLVDSSLKLCTAYVEKLLTEKHVVSEKNDAKASLNWHTSETVASRSFMVPQCSLRPLGGKSFSVLHVLKINLLDMDAALPEVALSLSKSSSGKRHAWREFVKSSESIYQMVQATIVLENMIKTEHLRNWWWYWSSLSAAAKVSTLSALALRIYSLDAAIIYDKTSLSSTTECLLPTEVRYCSQLPLLDSAEKPKLDRRSSKRRKESNG